MAVTTAAAENSTASPAATTAQPASTERGNAAMTPAAVIDVVQTTNAARPPMNQRAALLSCTA